MIGTNCYLVINEETKESVMVDPGAYPAKVKNAVKEQIWNYGTIRILTLH